MRLKSLLFAGVIAVSLAVLPSVVAAQAGGGKSGAESCPNCYEEHDAAVKKVSRDYGQCLRDGGWLCEVGLFAGFYAADLRYLDCMLTPCYVGKAEPTAPWLLDNKRWTRFFPSEKA